MPCTDPLHIKNPKYQPNKSNGGFPPPCPDPRLYSLRVPCGRCFACRKRRATDWRFRLHQEFFRSKSKRFHFVTFTFSDSALSDIRNGYYSKKGVWIDGIGSDATDNEVATVAVRRFLERYRKAYGVSLRHFLITELGEENERIHLHGIIIDCKCGYWKRNKFYADYKKLGNLWNYGYIWLGWCNEKSISYITKYITKTNSNDSATGFFPITLVSPGFGKEYVTSYTIRYHNTGSSYSTPVWYVTTSSGHKIAIPRYLRLKLFDPDTLFQRQLDLLDDPPPLIFKGVTYSDPISYHRAIYCEHMRTIALRTSAVRFILAPNRDIQENPEFLL